MDRIDLDHCATTPLDPRVGEVLAQAWRANYANAASLHAAGGRARRALEAAREELGRLLGLRTAYSAADRAIFTSGGTEANNLALLGLAGAPPGRVIVSSIEHPSVLAVADELARRGHVVERIAVDHDGVVSLDHLRQLLQTPARVAALMLGNHETGVLQPVIEAARLCRAAGTPLHVDAVQAVGKLPIQFAELDCATLSLTAHKFHGPRGIGALLVRHDVTLAPPMFGGFQQQGWRPGTESIELALGLVAALRFALEARPARAAVLAGLRDRFEALLGGELQEVIVHGRAAARLPHISNLAFLGCDRQALFIALDQAGLSCSTGSACQSGASEPSPVLRAMGLPAGQISSALRFSLGAGTEERAVVEAANRITIICNKLRRQKMTANLPSGSMENA